MTPRERLLTALHKGKPDRLPATIHGWMDYWINKYMQGASQFDVYRYFNMDAQIFYFQYLERPVVESMYFTVDLIPGHQWKVDYKILKEDEESTIYQFTIETPEGIMTKVMEKNDKMAWVTEYPMKEKEQIHWIEKYMPIPKVDKVSINKAFEQMGDMGILRAGIYGHQGGCWQDACNFVGTQRLIIEALDDPAWVHAFESILLERKLKFIDDLKGVKIDMLENGGGDGSMSVISPHIFKEFCLPYDRKLSAGLKNIGIATVYHTCGKMMNQLDLIEQVGADASETLTPSEMGGDADLRRIKKVLGSKMCLIGGFNQKDGFERGNPGKVHSLVRKCFEEAGCDGGYIMACSDHFFEGNPENIKAYVEAAWECQY